MINIMFFVFMMGLYCLCLVRKHILMCLISLEFIVIYILLFLYYFCLMFDGVLYLYIVLMTFFVCEGGLGLGIMVFYIRCHSNDYLNSMLMW